MTANTFQYFPNRKKAISGYKTCPNCREWWPEKFKYARRLRCVPVCPICLDSQQTIEFNRKKVDIPFDVLIDTRLSTIESDSETSRFNKIRDTLQKVCNETQVKVITLRFGLNNSQKLTLEDVGKILNVSRERVRQIEAKALRRMRTPTHNRALKLLWLESELD